MGFNRKESAVVQTDDEHVSHLLGEEILVILKQQ